MKVLKVDIAVIGAGSGGLSVASGAAQLGLKVVLFERGEMGGDCLNTGCVPSKALISAAKAAHEARHAGRLGIHAEPKVDFAAVMAHVHRTIETIAPIDSQERFEGLGVTVVRESARFVDRRTVASDSVTVKARKIIIAAGSRAAIPPIPGLADAPYLTNETVFELKALPEHLVIIGGGPIGLELGQAFRRLGAAVTVIEAGKALAKDDPDLAAVVISAVRQEGVDLREGVAVQSVETLPGGVAVSLAGGERIEASHLLVAAGRRPNLDGLDLDKAGIETNGQGVITDRQLRTTNPRVYAVGDITGRGAFTHAAGAHAGLIVRRTLFAAPINVESLLIPHATYTQPELASVGMTEAEARAAHGDKVKVLIQPFHDNDRAQAEGDTAGFGKLILDGKGNILGAGIVGAHAGDLIQPLVQAMGAKMKLSALASGIVAYPTRAEIGKRLAGSYFTPLLFSPRTRALVALLKRLA
jgi:pyruvate/2-oxoglutarate dehydrogenase complex dihydrolipoamide dehydrogenase (E3) component